MTDEVDPFPRRSLAAIGGPRGVHGRAISWRALVWPLVALAVVPIQIGVMERAYCIDHGWTSQDMFWRACFSDLPVQYASGGLDGGFTAYVTGSAGVDQPPLTGAVMALLGGLVGDGSVVEQQRSYFILWAMFSTLLVMATVWLTAATRPLHAALAAQVALSPILVLTVLVGPDIIGVVLVALGMWAWSRRQPTLAGVALGAAVMARTYPVLVLVALALLALRAGRFTDVRRTVAVAGTTAVLVAVLFAIADLGTLTDAYRAWGRTAAGFGSLWFLPQLTGHPLPAIVVTVLAVLGVLVAVVAGFLLALGAARRPTWAQVALVMVAIALVSGKSVPVQASLWLLPLAALAGVRWRDHLIWAGAETLYFVAVWLYAGGLSHPDRGMPPAWYAVFLLLRLAGIGWLVWSVWRRAVDRPAWDPAASWPQDPDRDELVDELAGPLTAAPDKVVAAYT